MRQVKLVLLVELVGMGLQSQLGHQFRSNLQDFELPEATIELTSLVKLRAKLMAMLVAMLVAEPELEPMLTARLMAKLEAMLKLKPKVKHQFKLV